MSTTVYHFKKIKDLESMAARSGFKIVAYNMSWSNAIGDMLALAPVDDNLPIFTRDTIIANGSAEELLAFLAGWQKSVEYLNMLNVCDEKRIKRKEQDYRNNELTRILKQGKKQR